MSITMLLVAALSILAVHGHVDENIHEKDVQVHADTRRIHHLMDSMKDESNVQQDGFVTPLEYLRFLAMTGGLHHHSDDFSEGRVTIDDASTFQRYSLF